MNYLESMRVFVKVADTASFPVQPRQAAGEQ